MSYDEEEEILNSGFSIDEEIDSFDEDLGSEFKEDFDEEDPDDKFH